MNFCNKANEMGEKSVRYRKRCNATLNKNYIKVPAAVAAVLYSKTCLQGLFLRHKAKHCYEKELLT
jgi:hypothetical protein